MKISAEKFNINNLTLITAFKSFIKKELHCRHTPENFLKFSDELI